jgi:hypothetical protein
MSLGPNAGTRKKGKTMTIATHVERESRVRDSSVNRANSHLSAEIHLQPRSQSLSLHGGPEQLLQTWKDIAAYMQRDVRTVQRWEKLLELPIHRLKDSRSGSVFAYKRELDAWRGTRALQIEACQAKLKAQGKAPEIKTPERIRAGVSFPWAVAVLSALVGVAASAVVRSSSN